MADVITRFKLETTQYDSKLRDASKSLAEYTRKAIQAGNEFGKFTQKNVEAARALGNITPSATNAKDKVKELVGAFNDAARAYNTLTKEQQQSDFGKAVAESIGQLSQKIKEAKQELYGMGDAVKKAGGGGLFSGMGDKMSGALQVFAGNMLTKAAGAVTSLGSEVADMVHQGVELARQGEGIRNAFERLGRGDVLDGLRQATHGTVTDIELMKAAVKFNDFKLPLDELGTMLAFAQQKAKDTGQSVDYMVDSIVTGLGRKSLMILDNLGLSAAEIKDKMAETGDMTKAVGAIIREQMAKSGDYVETAADRAAQANVSLQNKMEELGRKFAPLEEASNSLWTSMKIGILDVVGGPLTTLLNKLTETGRLMNAYGQMGGSGKVGRMTANLAGVSEQNRQSIYQQQQQQFLKYINPREQQIKDIRAWQRGERGEALQKRIGAITDKYGSLDVTKIQAEVDAAKKMLSEYQQAAKQILNPVKADVDTKGAEQNVESLKLKLIELEAQRKKAIATGDTELSKNLAKQITQVKSDINGLGGSTTNKTTTNTIKTEEQQNNEDIQKLTQEYIKASDDRRKAIEGEIKTLQDRNKEITRLKDMALGRIGDDGSLPAMTQQLKELQNAQSESASGREWDDYQKKIDDVTSKINVLKGVLPKDQQATFTVEVNAEQLEQLRMLLPSDEETVRINVEEGRVDLPDIPTEIEQVVNTKVGDVVTPKIATDIVQTISTRLGSIVTPDIAETLTQVINTKVGDVITPDIAEELTQVVNVIPGRIDLPELPKDETVRVNITATTADAMKEVRDMVGEIEGWQVEIEPKINIDEQDLRTPFEKLKDSLKIEIAEENMQVDTTTLQTLMKTAIQNGIDGLDPNFSALQEKMREGMNIPDETWQALQDEINEKLKELGIEPIKIDFKTGKIDESGKTVEKSWQSAARAVQAVGSAMESIEDPAAKIAGTVAQAIANIALGYSQAMLAPKDPVSWIAFGAAGLAQMLAMMNAIHSSTGYANGGIVKGNSYSGDNIPAMIDGGAGGFAGLNAGEIVLNSAQQNNVAQNLQGSGRDVHVTGQISGENIILAANRTFKRKGQGEIVTW